MAKNIFGPPTSSVGNCYGTTFFFMKLWDKGTPVNKAIEDFTVGKDRELDLFLATHDILGSMAHVTMLESVGLIEKDELPVLLKQLKKLYAEAEKGNFVIEDGVEDVHSQVEFLLTRELGDLGKKIHSGRSRNDQVLLDLKLFTRDAIKEITDSTSEVIDILISRAEECKRNWYPDEQSKYQNGDCDYDRN